MRPELNHRIARVLARCPGSSRYEVRFLGGQFHGLVAKVKFSNLRDFGMPGEDDPPCSSSAPLSWDSIPWHGADGLQQPWLPELLSLSWVRESLRRAMVSPGTARAKAAVRVVSLASATGRREFMAACIEELDALGVDCRFADAVDGRRLGLEEQQLRGDVHNLCVNGTDFTIDTSAWPRAGWTAGMMAEVERRFQAMRFFPHYWTAIRQNVQDPHTLGFVGGHMSHALIWQEAHESDLDWVLILEDDALPAPTLGLTWSDIWRVIACEIGQLRQRGEQWDILYVGRTLSMTPEGKRVSGILCEPGYCLRTHCYCLSRRGLARLLRSGVAATILHCPQDEVLATLCVGDHVHAPTRDKVAMLAPRDGWRALAVRWRGLTAQLIDVERSARAASQAAVHLGS